MRTRLKREGKKRFPRRAEPHSDPGPARSSAMRTSEPGGHSTLVSDEEKREGHRQAERRPHQKPLCRPRGPGARGRSSQEGLQQWPHGAWEGPKLGLPCRTELTSRLPACGMEPGWHHWGGDGDRANILLSTSCCDKEPHAGWPRTTET